MRPLNMLRNRRGVALPLSLLGLVIAAFLVTAAIVTSGTEILSSSAHRDATTALYSADAALEEYVVDKSNLAPAYADSLYPVVDDKKSDFLFNVARLYSTYDTLPFDTLAQVELYSVLARPSDGRGRSVGALVTTNRRAKMFSVNMPAALTTGGNLKVSGNSTVSDGRNTGCGASENAVQVTQGSTLDVGGTATIEGTADTTSFGKEELVDRYLGGVSLTESAQEADIKFAAGEFSQRVSSYDGTTPRDQTNKYNWGCPGNDADCALIVGNEANRAYHPTVAIDAGGGTVTIDNYHGQGILIIYNGSAKISGNFVYQGIVLVEQDVVIQGSSVGTGVKIEGTVMALGQNSTVEDNASGASTITYNKCIIEQMTDPINIPRVLAAPQIFPTRPHSWFEMVG